MGTKHTPETHGQSFEIALDALEKNNLNAVGAAAIRLCGSADDLLTALRAVVEAFTRHPGNQDERHHAIKLAYAAIAKATD